MTTRADRNNNPGNLIPPGGRIIWQGQTGVDADGFAVFSSRAFGERAADLNLQTYGKRGVDTVYNIIHTWSKTDQDPYTAAVAQGLGVSQSMPLDLTNPNVRKSVLAQIFNFESGTNRYSSGTLSDSWSEIQRAVDSGDYLGVPFLALGGLADGAGNVIGDALTPVADTITGALNPIAKWIDEGIIGTLKEYLIPIVVGGGALVLILVASWGMVKDTPVGSAVKTGAKAAVFV